MAVRLHLPSNHVSQHAAAIRGAATSSSGSNRWPMVSAACRWRSTHAWKRSRSSVPHALAVRRDVPGGRRHVRRCDLVGPAAGRAPARGRGGSERRWRPDQFGAKPAVLRCARCGYFVDWDERRCRSCAIAGRGSNLPPVMVREATDRDRRAARELFQRDFGRTKFVAFGEVIDIDSMPALVAIRHRIPPVRWRTGLSATRFTSWRLRPIRCGSDRVSRGHLMRRGGTAGAPSRPLARGRGDDER